MAEKKKRDAAAKDKLPANAEEPTAIKVGADCIYTYMVNGPELEDTPAKIAAVWPGQVVDIDVKLGDRTRRHYRVHPAPIERVAHTWRLP